MKNQCWLMFIILVIATPIEAQSLSVSGVALDPQDRPIADAHVTLNVAGRARMTGQTNASGIFRFDGVEKSSAATLIVTAPGFAPLRTSVDWTRPMDMRLRLLLAGTTESVVVRAKADAIGGLPETYGGGDTARGGRLGVLGNADAMLAPFAISSYTDQAIQNQQAATAADVLSRDPSIRSTGQSAGILDAFLIRGFAIGEGNTGEVAFDGQYGVAPNYRVFADYAERIEVVKGPSALLYGMSPNSGIGGVINIVPKRATRARIVRFRVDYAANTQFAERIDMGRRFGPNGEFGARFNGSHQQGDTPLDRQSRKADVGSLALDYTKRRFRSSMDLIGQRERFDAPSRPFVTGAGMPIPDAPNGRRNVSQRWEWANVQDRSVLAHAEFDVTNSWTLFGSGGGVRTDVDRVFGTPTILNGAGDTTTTPGRFQFDIGRHSSEGGLRGRFQTAGIRHAVSVQGSWYGDWLARGSNNGTAMLSNLYRPAVNPGQVVPAPTLVPKISATDLSGAAVTDTMSVFEERVQVTIGGRLQNVTSQNFSPVSGAVTASYDKRAFTPLVGIVVRPWQKVSFYANHIEGLSKGDIAPPTAVNAGEVFAPYKAKQYEGGVKLDWGRLMTTASFFQITKPGGQLDNLVYRINAEQRNRGFEATVTGEVARHTRILGGLTLMDGELTKTNNVRTLGRHPIGVPSVQGNLSAEWDTPTTRPLTLQAGLSYTGRQYADQANTQLLKDWTRWDFGGRYTIRAVKKNLTFRANLVNAFDRRYWAGVASWGGFVQGAPRTVLLSTTLEF